jgi:hypothetical protein
MRVVNLCLLYLIERAKFWAHRLVLVTNFYATRYIVGRFVMGISNEACYSQIIVCNELQLTPVTDT